ncbi:uncharacterized protein LOC133198638 [Saccostrea echinata]|uniref:uncharacterized protein LOC133198638 n=1 Tax=Saccostrea echinata TaxID=191078 RepID=UPI002A82DB98|nr:uncharacterized protein LOC133198638 [Saccostrea echinata]
MESMRYKFWTKQFEQRVEWFIDKISESKKNQHSICFQIESGKTVCGSCFQFLLRMNRNFYYTCLKMANDGKTAAGYRNTRGCGVAKEGAIVWLKNYEFFHADRMPNNGDMMLPFKTKKRDIYNMYVNEKIECLERSIFDALTVSQSAFYDIWKNDFPHLKIKQTNSFSKCSTCVHIERELEKTRDLSKRTKLKQMMRVHNQRQMTERRYYYRKRDIAKNYPQKHMSIIIDGMDQSKTNLPHFTGRLMKGIDPNSFLKTHVQGVLNHGMGTFDVYVDINEYCHDSNLVMNVILKTIHNAISKDGYLPQRLYIQADNCARENKNRFVLGFCELLVRLSIFHEVHLSFLHVGHTHEDIDAAFSQLAMRLRRSEAETMPKLLNILNGAKQLRGLFDIKSWLQPHLREIKHHSKPLHFKFSRNEAQKITMQYRTNSNRTWKTTEEEGILNGIPLGEPRILLPSNFHKIDLPNIRNNIQKHQYNMSDEGQFRWWISYLEYLQVVKDDERSLNDYALEGAIWLLPQLEGKQRKSEEVLVEINSHLLEMLDKELDDYKVIMSKGKKEDKKKKIGRKGRSDRKDKDSS